MTLGPPLLVPSSFFGISVNLFKKKRKGGVNIYIYLRYIGLGFVEQYGLSFKPTTLLQRFGQVAYFPWVSQDENGDSSLDGSQWWLSLGSVGRWLCPSLDMQVLKFIRPSFSCLYRIMSSGSGGRERGGRGGRAAIGLKAKKKIQKRVTEASISGAELE